MVVEFATAVKVVATEQKVVVVGSFGIDSSVAAVVVVGPYGTENPSCLSPCLCLSRGRFP